MITNTIDNMKVLPFKLHISYYTKRKNNTIVNGSAFKIVAKF